MVAATLVRQRLGHVEALLLLLVVVNVGHHPAHHGLDAAGDLARWPTKLGGELSLGALVGDVGGPSVTPRAVPGDERARVRRVPGVAVAGDIGTGAPRGVDRPVQVVVGVVLVVVVLMTVAPTAVAPHVAVCLVVPPRGHGMLRRVRV
jgi:hypothetical protein